MLLDVQALKAHLITGAVLLCCSDKFLIYWTIEDVS
jgi:hypothetical protein